MKHVRIYLVSYISFKCHESILIYIYIYIYTKLILCILHSQKLATTISSLCMTDKVTITVSYAYQL